MRKRDKKNGIDAKKKHSNEQKIRNMKLPIVVTLTLAPKLYAGA